MLNSFHIRKNYLEFFKGSKDHVILPSDSILPENDPSTLFTGSGMQPMVPYLLGEKHPAGNKLVNAQKCFRTEDIDEVGDHRHNTFFEMLGNWSLGDYFKQEQLSYIFEFLTNILNIPADKIYVSVFAGNDKIGIPADKEAVEIWQKLFKAKNIEAKAIKDSENLGLQGGRIFYYPDKKNWWSRSGTPDKMPLGEPGGPDSEIFYDTGAKHDIKFGEYCHINCDCGRFIEIGNNVFMAYRKTESGFQELTQKNIDFGGGLERIVMAAQGKTNIFQTDLFSNIILKIEELSGQKYENNPKAFEVIADHIKAAVFIIGDNRGVGPSNTDQGYFVRRLIRRAIRYGLQLEIKQNNWTKEIAEIVIKDYQEAYPELANNKLKILAELNQEEKKFSQTLERGTKEFDKIEGEVSGHQAFILFSSYGFPIEITEELAAEKGLKVDRAGFSEEMKKHQELSRTASAGKFKGGLADSQVETTRLHTAAHLMLQALREVLGDQVSQKGSNITAERLRFDFSYPEKLTDEQKEEVENLVNQAIEANAEINCEEMSVEEAKAQGAIGVFDSKYSEKVKVYTAEKEGKIFSREICGGPHVKYTGELGKFKIQKEESSGAGVRRIKAILEIY